MAGDYTPNPALLFSQPPAGSGNLVFAQDGGCAPYAPSAALVFDAAPTTSASLVFSEESSDPTTLPTSFSPVVSPSPVSVKNSSTIA